MTRKCLRAAIAAACLFISTSPALCRGLSGYWRSCPTDDQAYDEQMGLIPGVSWDAWRILLPDEWSDEQKNHPQWFETQPVIAAADAAPGTIVPEDVSETYWRSQSALRGTDADFGDADAYARASALFRAGHWHEAKQAFEPLASGTSSLRPAAAYSAARAALDAGDVNGGIQRLAALLADPADAHMYLAAHHLLGAMAYHTGASPLRAARLTEISHLITAPPQLRCDNGALKQLTSEANDDLDTILRHTFPNGRLDQAADDAQYRDVLTAVGVLDPVIDLVRVLAVPTGFGISWKEPFVPERIKIPNAPLEDQPTLEAEATYAATARDYARIKAKQTGNPLWVYALARLTSDPNDLALIAAAETSTLAKHDAADDRHVLAAWLRAQRVRILLMSGRTDLATKAVSLEVLVPLTPSISDNTWVDEWTPLGFLNEGGTRFLLASGETAAARSWAKDTRPVKTSWYSKANQDEATATNWEELIEPGTKQPSQNADDLGNGMPLRVAAVLDLLPADHLVELARTPGLARTWRRPILAAAWMRYYILGRDAAFERLFPEIQDAFPETVVDLEAIQAAWLPFTRRRLITRMLLRLPGLSPRVSWNRDVTRWGPVAALELSATDAQNPNDGNWWCPLDPARVRREAIGAMAQGLIQYRLIDRELWDDSSPALMVDKIALSWIRNSPLTHDVDYSELEALSHVRSGPARLVDQVLHWAHWSDNFTRWFGLDQALPETLALAIRATRYGCRVAGPLGLMSRAAWMSLHGEFPESEWAKHTPYWYDETRTISR